MLKAFIHIFKCSIFLFWFTCIKFPNCFIVISMLTASPLTFISRSFARDHSFTVNVKSKRTKHDQQCFVGRTSMHQNSLPPSIFLQTLKLNIFKFGNNIHLLPLLHDDSALFLNYRFNFRKSSLHKKVFDHLF